MERAPRGEVGAEHRTLRGLEEASRGQERVTVCEGVGCPESPVPRLERVEERGELQQAVHGECAEEVADAGHVVRRRLERGEWVVHQRTRMLRTRDGRR